MSDLHDDQRSDLMSGSMRLITSIETEIFDVVALPLVHTIRKGHDTD